MRNYKLVMRDDPKVVMGIFQSRSMWGALEQLMTRDWPCVSGGHNFADKVAQMDDLVRVVDLGPVKD